MFLGQHKYSLDSQNHLTIPPHFRDLLANQAFITQGFDHNLLVLTADSFHVLYERFTAMNIADPLARLLLRMILGNATELEVNETGQITVPENLRTFAGLEDDVILVGQGKYFEVWTPSQWQKQEIRIQDVDANANRFAGLMIAG